MHELTFHPTAKEIMQDAIEVIKDLEGHIFDVISIKKPEDIKYAEFLSKTISKLSSITGNMIEERMANHLNEQGKYHNYGKWIRQDPGFPDNIFQSDYLDEIPGIEVKAWFPFATEITARFKGSSLHCGDKNTYVALIAWAPEFILHGRPKILDVWIGLASEIAMYRDKHYYNPPHYLVVEPQNTQTRTVNLRQSNVEGYVIQTDTESQKRQLEAAENEVKNWDEEDLINYSPSPEIIQKINDLRSRYSYRQDTNFAKLDRIRHPKINSFKNKVYKKIIHGQEISYWRKISRNGNVLSEYFDSLK